MSDVAFAEFEQQIELLSFIQLRQLRNKIDALLTGSKQKKKSELKIAPITASLMGIAHIDNDVDYDELIADCIMERYV